MDPGSQQDSIGINVIVLKIIFVVGVGFAADDKVLGLGPKCYSATAERNPASLNMCCIALVVIPIIPMAFVFEVMQDFYHQQYPPLN